MAGNVELVYTISKQAAKLVKAGKAEISSGGVRKLTGEIIELAKPAAKTVLNSGTSSLNLVSSLANNVQSGFIQHSVNKANLKLDISLKKLDQIQETLNGLAFSQTLSWVNCAFGLLNCGISIAGFAMTLQKLEGIQKQIEAIGEKIDIRIKNEYMEKFYRYWLFINSDIDTLKEYKLSPIEASNIREHLDEIAGFLLSIIKQIKASEIDKMFGLALITNLSAVFAKLVSEYSAQYFYENGKYPANYDAWVNIIYEMDDETFYRDIKKYLIFERNDILYEDRIHAYTGMLYTIKKEVSEIEVAKQTVLLLDKNDYMTIDNYLNTMIQNGDYSEFEDYVCVPVPHK